MNCGGACRARAAEERFQSSGGRGGGGGRGSAWTSAACLLKVGVFSQILAGVLGSLAPGGTQCLLSFVLCLCA